MGHAGFVVFVETGLWLAVKWAVQIFAPLHLDQMDSSVLECLASHKSREREMMSLTCQEREKKCVNYYIYHKMCGAGKLL